MPCLEGGDRGMLCEACERELFAAARERVLAEQRRPGIAAEELFTELLTEVTAP